MVSRGRLKQIVAFQLLAYTIFWINFLVSISEYVAGKPKNAEFSHHNDRPDLV